MEEISELVEEILDPLGAEELEEDECDPEPEGRFVHCLINN